MAVSFKTWHANDTRDKTRTRNDKPLFGRRTTMKDLTWPCSDKKPFHFGIVGTMISHNSGGMRWLDDVNLPCVDALERGNFTSGRVLESSN